ncbi:MULTISPECIES: DUF6571 family protein [Streptomyces]|uniref:DUF6571 family protein n=1 Tax=Streptomyces TaxID=1883 RepID=UPI0007897CE2|nr:MULTISPECIES: DUF6571 family protein [unclassified Streptomyces]AVH95152.1 hypothetical protein C5L38_08790 [Streptomyces sp. WAC00288]KYG53845.1 hypothetical protein AWI43_04685 [Streptomyces sp. WAC04657]
MDFEALHSANFKLLDDTVADWTSMLGRLQALKQDARDGLQGKARKANWAGDNAVIGREFVGKTAGEFGDALTQATSIRNIMRDTRDELKTQQRLLKEAVERGRGKNLTVTANGGGFIVRENPDKKAPGGQSDVNGLRDELQGILNRATEIDTSASTSLKALVDLADHGFSDAVYKDRDSAANAVKEAEKLAALAKKKPEDLTPADFDALNAGLGKYSGDPIFAEHFASTLGPKGTLEFWTGLNDPRLAYKVASERFQQYDDLQKNLSLTLAAATQADTPEMTRWKHDMVNMADQPLSKSGTMFGAQVMSNLMRWGNFDDQFLKDYGTKLIETEKKLSENGRHVPLAWQHMVTDPLLNRTGTDSGSDPMTGFLRALSNSPDAATDFFKSDFVTKDEDHDFKKKVNGKEEKIGLSNFDYFFEERDWPKDQDDKGKESTEGRNSLAMALEAATTGHPAGEMRTEDTLPHNKDQAELMQKVVSSIGSDPERLTKHIHMADSIGQMTSEYLPDINRAISDDKGGNSHKLFPIVGTPAEFEHADVTRLLFSVGQDPKGNAAVEVGQAAYLGNLMDHHLNPNIPQDMRYPQSPQDTAEMISRRSAEIGGTLALGRQEAIVGPAAKEAKDFADSIAQQKNAWSGAVSTGIGVGVSFIATPVGGAVASGVASTVSSVVLEHIFQQSETDVLKEAGKESSRVWEQARQDNIAMSRIAAEEAAKSHNLPYTDQVATRTLKGTDDGLSDASDNTSRMADDLNTEIQPE